MRHPYVLNIREFPSTRVLLYRDFPDVFSKEYRENAVAFASQLEAYREDEYLIGYFLSNEPHWAFGDNNLAFEMFAVSAPSKPGSSSSVSWKRNTKTFNPSIHPGGKAWHPLKKSARLC